MADDKPLINVEVSSPISLKAEIKTEIPSESSGRLLDALTDIIRPFTETRGLRADVIRLQREEVLIEIAKRALERARIENTELHPVPNKFLVPFLEKASLEDIESPLIDKWAELLHSAASSYDAAMVRFTSVLAEIGPKELEFLEKLVSGCRSWHAVTQMEDIPIVFTPTQLLSNMRRRIDESTDLENALATFVVANEYPGAIFREVDLGVDERRVRIENNIISHDDNATIAILSSVGVLNQDTIITQIDVADVWIDAVWLTSFGVSFVVSCSGAVRDKMKEIERWQISDRMSDLPSEWKEAGGLEKIYSSILSEVNDEEDEDEDENDKG